MVHRDERGAVCEAVEGCEVDVPVVGVGCDVDDDPPTVTHVEVGAEVGLVLRRRGDDAVPCAEFEAVERHVPCPGGVVGEGDLGCPSADELCEDRVDRLDVVGERVTGLVAAPMDLVIEVGVHGIDHGEGHECGASVVEVGHVPGSRRVTPQAIDIDHGMMRPSMPPATVTT